MARLRLVGVLGAVVSIGAACSSSKNNSAGSGGGPYVFTGGSGNTPATTGGAGGNGGAGGEAGLPGLIPFTPSMDIELQACTGKEWEPETRPVILEMVIDVSTSMRNQPPNAAAGDTRSKWEMTRDALLESLDHLPAAALLGLTFFPDKTTVPNFDGGVNANCISTSDNLAIAPLGNKDSDARKAVVDRLNAIAIPDNAGTPTHDAYRIALDAVQAKAAEDPRYAAAPKYILLITDGQPTFSLGCIGKGAAEYPVDPEPIITEIGNAYTNSQIETFIIGSPGSEGVVVLDGGTDARPWLSRAATAGNTASYQPGCSNTAPPYCHFDMTTVTDFGSALGTTLQKITGAIAPCDYAVIAPDGTVLDPSLVNVVYTDASLQKYAVVQNQTTGDCPLGWRYTDSTGTTIQICGATCNYIGQDAFATMKILFGCISIAKPT
jgi:hypothetical protein